MAERNPPQKPIAVLFGGTSAEREVSLRSGSAIAAALTRRGYRCELIDPQQTPLERVDWDLFEKVFIALHGTFGEDGSVQAFLEERNVIFSGSDSRASRLAFDKSAAKECLAGTGIAVPPGVAVESYAGLQHIVGLAGDFGFPLVVKPNAQGSSFGVTICQRVEEVQSAFELAAQFDSTVLLERYIAGEEWTIGVLHENVLPAIQIQPAVDFYDYEAKYDDTRTSYEVVTRSTATTSQLQQHTLAACAALDVSGAVRVDFRVDTQGNAWFLEVNTVPGMTETSLLPLAAQSFDIPFDCLCEFILYPDLFETELKTRDTYCTRRAG